MKRNKILSLLLAGTMVLALSACTKTPTSSTAQTSSTQPQTSSVEEDPYKDAVTLKWYMRRSEPANVDSVFEAINKVTKEKINATVEMIWVEPSTYDTTMQMRMGSGEVYDLAFTSNWANDYASNVASKAYIAIDEYMNDKYMPDIMAATPDYFWDGIRINNKVWALPNLQTMVNEAGFDINLELAEKYNLVDKIKNMKTQDDLKEILMVIKQNEPKVYPIRDMQMVNDDVDAQGNFIESDLGLGFYFTYDNATGKVKFTGDTERFINKAKTAREWYELGLLPDDSTVMEDYINLLKAKRLFCGTGTIKPGGAEEMETNYGYKFIEVPSAQKVVKTSQIRGTLTGVSITSEHPERAIAFYNLLYKDVDLYNTLVYGIKDQDFKFIDEKHVERIKDQYVQSAWQVGNSFNAYLTGTQSPDLVQQIIDNNSTAKQDQLYGFSVDLTKIEAEYAAVQATGSQYNTVLTCGLNADVDSTLKEYHDKAFAAGAQTIIDEVQKQVDAFLAAKK